MYMYMLTPSNNSYYEYFSADNHTVCRNINLNFAYADQVVATKVAVLFKAYDERYFYRKLIQLYR